METTTILLAFVTGLTTGGLSCFAVQGGLLTSSIASFAEKNTPRSKLLQPILLFLTSKLVVYTLLGFLLGWIGTVFFPSAAARGWVQILVGIFMVGNGLRMLNVHPFFRIFTFEPPKKVTRMIRRTAKGGDENLTTPLVLGALTVLIPCGVTQVMMATAVGTGSPWMGAAILFAFVLGASPTFFGVTYLATRLSAMFEKNFFRILGTAILLLGFYSVETGLVLTGSPVSVTRIFRNARSEVSWLDQTGTGASAGSGSGAAENENPLVNIPALNEGLNGPESGPLDMGDSTDLTITVFNTRYSPDLIYAPADKPIKLTLVTDGVYSCALAFVIPDLNQEVLLYNTGETTIDLPPQPAGKKMDFMCSMGMFTGQIIYQ